MCLRERERERERERVCSSVVKRKRVLVFTRGDFVSLFVTIT